MRQTIKYFLWIVCLLLGAKAAWAFSLLGPIGSAGATGGQIEDNWQIPAIGYNPLTIGNAPPFIGTTTHAFGPKNLGEGYRYNTPVIYYTFDPDFVWFGANGEDAVDQAFDTLNGVLNGQTNTPMFIVNPITGILMGATNGVFNGPSVTLGLTNGVDKYTMNLTEFPLNSQGINYTAQTLELTDLKSITLALMMEQLGLADAIRYTWGLLDRDTTGATCTPTTPPSAGPGLANGVTYETIMRNFDIVPSSLTNLQYSPYVNSSLYSYYVWETCGAAGFSPPLADAIDVLVDPLNYNPPVASGWVGEGPLLNGSFYTGLTRDDVAGLRYLLSTNNIFDTAPGFLEPPAAGSVLFFTNTAPLAQQQLATTNYNALFTAALTNSPANLQALFPGLTFTNITSFYSNVVSSQIIFVTNTPIGGVSGQQYIGTQAVYSTNIVVFYQYAFDNVVTNKIYNSTTYALQTIIVGPPIGQPVGTAFTTNVSYQTFQSNIVSGDYFIISNGFCGPNIIQTLRTNVNVVTNLISGVTNTDGSSIVQNLIYYYTNYIFVVQPCTLVTNAVADYQGIGRMQFVRVSDDNFDYQNGQFYVAVTNQYSMVIITNHQYMTRTFQRVVTRPDILFGAQSLLVGGNAVLTGAQIADSQPNFIDSRGPNLAGPGIIDPTAGTNIVINFDDTGPLYQNTGPNSLTGPGGVANLASINWASFDGTTNPPVVYPNGTSIANLAAALFVHVSPPPPALPNGTAGVGYSATLTATGGQPPYTWTLSPNSAGLPHGLTLSSNGVISGTPTQSGTFDEIIIQTTDFSYPVPIVVDTVYSLTIN